MVPSAAASSPTLLWPPAPQEALLLTPELLPELLQPPVPLPGIIRLHVRSSGGVSAVLRRRFSRWGGGGTQAGRRPGLRGRRVVWGDGKAGHSGEAIKAATTTAAATATTTATSLHPWIARAACDGCCGQREESPEEAAQEEGDFDAERELWTGEFSSMAFQPLEDFVRTSKSYHVQWSTYLRSFR